ncbi:MAG: hypothetical protein KJN92_04540, partial [Gemmatimonadetes bacterium]|nr:hypothetical protein [Gemmatimonadota bacterium]
METLSIVGYSEWDPGEYEFEVYNQAWGLAEPTGGYEFTFLPINRAPESVSPTVSLGDTVRGESISDPDGGDRDEFEIELALGDTVAIYFQALSWD